MDAWDYEAKTINLDSNWNNIPLYKCSQFEDFVRNKDKHFVVGPKGIGKTLFLKAKSKIQRESNPNLNCYPQNELCEKIGSGLIASDFQELANRFSSVKEWELVWGFTLSTAILIHNGETLSDEVKKLIAKAKTVDSILSIILRNRSDLFKVFDRILIEDLLPKLEENKKVAYIFIDNVDEAFSLGSQSIEDQNKHKSLFRSSINCQIGFINSSITLMNKCSHIKIYSSIRSEVLTYMNDSNFLQNTQLFTEIEYNSRELLGIFLANIEKTTNKDLKSPNEIDELSKFIGFKNIENEVCFDADGHRLQENVFDYILRHTFGRPREIVYIGSKIREDNKANKDIVRTEEDLRRLVAKESNELFEQYKREVRPYLEETMFSKLTYFLESNIFNEDDFITLATKFNHKTTRAIKKYVTHLYNFGLIGVLENHGDNESDTQTFKRVGYTNFERYIDLPKSPYYLVHPIVNTNIENRNGNFTYISYSIIGNNYSFPKQTPKGSNRHVHIGAGKLGLGFAVPLFSQIGNVTVIQRPSEAWDKLQCDKVTILTTDKKYKQSFSVVREINDESESDLVKLKNRDLFILSQPSDLTKNIINNADSISISIGHDYSDIIPLLNQLDGKKEVLVFPFENEEKHFKNHFTDSFLESKKIKLMKVLADRICSSRTIEEDKIIIATEDYQHVTIGTSEPQIKSLFFNIKDRVKIVETKEEFSFYFNQKLYIVNGLHMALALIALSPYPINERDKTISVKHLVQRDEYKEELEVFSEIQTLRLLLEWKEKNEKSNITKLVDQKQKIDGFIKQTLDRFEHVDDLPTRILDITDTERFKEKWKSRINTLTQFLKKNENTIPKMLEDINKKSTEEHVFKNDLQKMSLYTSTLGGRVTTIAMEQLSQNQKKY